MNIPEQTVVSETGDGQFTQKIIIGSHVLSTDEPVINCLVDSGIVLIDYNY